MLIPKSFGGITAFYKYSPNGIFKGWSMEW